MTKTESIRTARRAIGHPCGRGTSWSVYGPYYSNAEGLRGPSTEVHASSYWQARALRAQWVAYLALRLMGWDQDEADVVYCCSGDSSRIEDIIADAVKRGRS
jgi:hypothetical protein